jgi:hypothetical protein
LLALGVAMVGCNKAKDFHILRCLMCAQPYQSVIAILVASLVGARKSSSQFFGDIRSVFLHSI